MIRRSENGPLCTHCTTRNPAALIEKPGELTCIHCGKPFTFWIEKLPFYCTDDGRSPRCDCDICTGRDEPAKEIEPVSGDDG